MNVRAGGLLRNLLWLMGVSTVAIGLYHFVGGIWSVPGTGSVESTARATVDSRERFYNAIFAGYGLTWVWVARQPKISLPAVNGLAGVFMLGGIGRLVSAGVHGRPHWFQIPLIGLEIVVPLVFFALVAAEGRGPVERRRQE